MNYICVTCGAPAAALYKQLSPDVLKLLHCSRCDHVVDKYVEYDATLITIDVILQQHQAYRHILFNAGPHHFWKLAVILVLCDSYALWTQRRPPSPRSEHRHQPPPPPPFAFPIQPEWDFYATSLVAVAEAVVFLLVVQGVLALLRMRGRLPDVAGSPPPRPATIVHAVIVGGCGKLLALPAYVWGTHDDPVHIALMTLFIALSEMHVLEAVSRISRLLAIVTVGLALGTQYAVRQWLLSVVIVH